MQDVRLSPFVAAFIEALLWIAEDDGCNDPETVAEATIYDAGAALLALAEDVERIVYGAAETAMSRDPDSTAYSWDRQRAAALGHEAALTAAETGAGLEDGSGLLPADLAERAAADVKGRAAGLEFYVTGGDGLPVIVDVE